jgi:hypothetical protein
LSTAGLERWGTSRSICREKGERGRKKRRRERGADWKRCRKDDFRRGKGGEMGWSNGLVMNEGLWCL